MLAERLPRSWSAALEQLRRDVTVLRRRAVGHGLPPLVPRPTPVRVATTNLARGEFTTEGRDVAVARVDVETASALTLVLRDGAPFAFRPGQFFTVLADVAGEVVPRNYSASNAPGTDELHLTIRIKESGRVSPLLARLRPGDRLRVLGPFGSFGSFVAGDIDAASRRRLVLVAGGAGITPLASIARTVLAQESDAEIALVYANRHADDVIFADALEALARERGGRLTVVHVTGPLDRATASRALDVLPLASHPDTRFLVCGPDGMRDEVLAVLSARGVPDAAIAMERFSIGPRPHIGTSSAAIAAAVGPGARPLAIRIKDRTHRTTALPGATVLEAGLAAGAPMPFSCAVGGCGACKLKVVEGSVEVEEPNCLTDVERAAGFVLACVGRPCGPCVLEVVDVNEATQRGGA